MMEENIWRHRECLDMQYRHLMKLINERDRLNARIRVVNESYDYFRRQIAQAEADRVTEFDPDRFKPKKEEAN